MSRFVYNRILIVVTLSLMTLFPVPLLAGQNENLSQGDIFQWVAHELGILEIYPVPEIKLVSKKILQKVLQDEAGKNLEGLIGIYGGADPESAKRHYLNNILGLFLPGTEMIYVREDLGPCRMGSIMAHEFTHYYQVRLYGRTDSLRPHEQEEIHIFREAEAREIEKIFLQKICN